MASRVLAFLLFVLIGLHGLTEQGARVERRLAGAEALADKVLRHELKPPTWQDAIPKDRVDEFNLALARWNPDPVEVRFVRSAPSHLSMSYQGGFLVIVDAAVYTPWPLRGLQAFVLPEGAFLKLAQGLLLLVWTGLLARMSLAARRLRARLRARHGETRMAGIEVPTGMPRSELLTALMDAEAENRRLREQL